MDYHPTTHTIVNLLEQNGLWFESFEHEPVTTSEEAAKVREGKYSLSQGAKALILRVKESSGKRFVMVVLPGDQKFSGNRLKKILNSKDIRFATVEEINKLTNGIVVGGVPPFGNLFELEVIADIGLFKNDKIVFNAGDRRFSVAMKATDYKKLVNPRIEQIT